LDLLNIASNALLQSAQAVSGVAAKIRGSLNESSCQIQSGQWFASRIRNALVLRFH
jgi:hypothetical protein